MKLIQNSLLRTFVFAGGCLSLFLGFVGIFIPLLPTTPFVLLAAWCFLRSSPKAHAWIYRHPMFGKPLTDWERNRAIAPRTKAVALLTIVVSLAFMWTMVKIEWVRYSVTLFMTCVSIFILTRRNS